MTYDYDLFKADDDRTWLNPRQVSPDPMCPDCSAPMPDGACYWCEIRPQDWQCPFCVHGNNDMFAMTKADDHVTCDYCGATVSWEELLADGYTDAPQPPAAGQGGE